MAIEVEKPEPPSPLDYHATLERMEPGLAPIGELAAVSIAVSLKRIADELPRIEVALNDIRYAVNTAGNNGMSIAPAINSLKGDIGGVMNAVTGLHATINAIRADQNTREVMRGQGIHNR